MNQSNDDIKAAAATEEAAADENPIIDQSSVEEQASMTEQTSSIEQSASSGQAPSGDPLPSEAYPDHIVRPLSEADFALPPDGPAPEDVQDEPGQTGPYDPARPPKLSVVVPVYNAEPYLEAAVKSVLGQTFGDFELLLIDDGSTDGSRALLRRFAEEDSHVTVIEQENHGPSYTRNLGIEKARGEYLYFMDADDAIEPDCFAHMMKLAEKYHPDLLVFGFQKEWPGHPEKTRQYKARFLVAETHEAVGNLLPVLLENRIQSVMGNKIYRTTFVRQFRFDEKVDVYEDCLFHYAIYNQAESIVIADRIFYHYYQRPAQSLVKAFRESRFDWLITQVTTLRSLFASFGLERRYEQLWSHYLMDNLMVYLTVVMRESSGLTKDQQLAEIRRALENETIREMLAKIRGGGLKRRIACLLMRTGKPGLVHAFLRMKG